MEVGYLVSRVEDHNQTLNPERVAIQLESEEAWTYGELNSMTNRYANVLERLGVKKGDRVGILLYNSLEYIALYFAIAKLGAIAVRLNFRLESEELEYILNDSGTSVLCFDEKLTDKIEPIRHKTQVNEFICAGDNVPNWAREWNYLLNGSAHFESKELIDKSDPVMLMYTSGTTGRPKGALWTHESTLWFASMQMMKWGLDSNTVGMTTGPLYHVGAFEDVSIGVLLAGGTVVITKSTGFEIERVLSVIEENGVTDCFMFPFMINEMLNLPSIESFDLNKMKRIITGGDPLTPWVIDQLKKKFSNIGLVQVYGLTEGTPIATALDPEDAQTKGYTAGKPMPFTQVKIVDDHNNRLGFNEVGEVCVKGPVVSVEYWNKPEETSETFIDGWCHTGDLGYLDEEGYLTISGRKKDMIRSGGENIYPVELEDVLIRHEKIQDVAVIGIPDPKFIETVCAVVVPKGEENITESDIHEFLEGKLASYKKPRKLVIVDELPRTASGKIQKFRLREQFSYASEQL